MYAFPYNRQLLQRKRALTAIEEGEVFFLEQPEQGRNISNSESELFCRKLAGTKGRVRGETEATVMPELKSRSLGKPYQTLPASRKVSRPAVFPDPMRHSEKKKVGISSEQFAAAAEEQPGNSTSGPGTNFPEDHEDEIGLNEDPKQLCMHCSAQSQTMSCAGAHALQCKLITEN